MVSNVRRVGTIGLAAIMLSFGLPILPLLPTNPAHAAPILTATKDDALVIDNDGDGLVDPGDTLRYTVTLTNSGSTDATDVEYFDTIDPNTTMVPGSVRTTPIARHDNYSALGNVSMTVPAASGVLANDEDPDGTGMFPGVTVSASPPSSVNGGTVAVAADGSFTYDPPAGFEGIDSFAYSIIDSDGLTDGAQVFINVADIVWFIDNSSLGSNKGTYSNPFTSITSFNASAAVSPGNAIFAYQGSGPYVDGIVLQNSHLLFGQGVDLLAELASEGIFPPAHSDLTTSPAFPNRPTLTHAAGDGITLAQNNTMRGLDVGSTSGTAIVGSNVATAVIDTLAIQSTGGGVDVVNGVLAVTLDSIATSGGTTGINLANMSGSFTVLGASSVNNAPGTSMVINGGSVSVSLADLSITNRNGTGIHITGATGTSVTFGDVDIPNPKGASGYGIRVDGSSANVSLDSADISNTIQSLAEIDGGGDGIPDNDGDGDAIFLSANSGSFSLTGAGTQGNAGSLSNIADHGVDTRNVSGTITLNDLSIQDIGVGSSNPASVHPDGIFAYNLSGSLSLDGASISEFDARTNSRGIHVLNVGTDFTEIRVENTPIQNTGGIGGDDAFLLEARGAVNGAIVIADDNPVGAGGHRSTWSGLSGYGVQVLTGNSGGSGTITAEIRNIEFKDAVNPGGLGGIEFVSQSTAALDVDIVGNTLEQLFNANALGFGMVHFAAFGSSSLTANVASNTIDGSNGIAADDGRRGIYAVTGDLPGENVQVFDLTIDSNTINATAHEAIYVDIRGDALSTSGPGEVRITNNTIGATTPVAQSGREGIELRARDASKTVNLLVDNNTVRNADNGSSDETIDLDAEDTTTLNATVTNNTFTSANSTGGLDEFEAETDDVGSTMCLDLRGNTASQGGGTGNGTFHADAAAGSTINRNYSGNLPALVSETGTGTFGAVGSCALPTATSSAAVATSTSTETGLDTTAAAGDADSTPEASESSESSPPTPLETATAEEPASTELLVPTMVSESPTGFSLPLGLINPGQIVVITFDVEVNDPVGLGGTLVCNQGRFVSFDHVDLFTDDPSTGLSDDPTCTIVEQNPPDLQLVKSDDGVSVQAGGTVEYTLTFTNVGGGDATGVIITDTVPTNTTFNAAASTPGWSCADGDPAGTTCTLPVGSILAGGSGVATFAATVDRPIASGVDFIVNAAEITDDGAGGEDANPGDNFSVAVTPLVTPDLQLVKSDDGVSVQAGGTVEYTLTFTNVGGGDATGVIITDTVPTNTTFNAAASTPGWSCADGDPAGTTCTLPVGSILAGGSGVATFAATVDRPIASGVDFIVNAAEITDDGAGGEDANPGDNFSVAVTPVDAAPDLVIDKDDGGATPLPGSTITYSLSYANAGPQGATGVEITDTVPANTTFNAVASTAGWSCSDGDPAGTACSFPIGSIGGESAVASVDFAVTVDGSVPADTVVSNTATIADDGSNGPDENPGDNTDTEETPVDQPPTADAGGPYSGDEGQDVALDGSGSSDDLEIVLYEWDCTNDGSFDVSSASPTGNTCTYPDNGSYTLRLRVTDTGDQKDEDTATVTVNNVAPEVSANPDDQTVQYSDYIAPVTVTATDVDADTPDDITTEWKVAGDSFASGLPAALELGVDGCGSDGTTTTCGWTIDGFADVAVGDYTIRVTVSDEDGGTTSTTVLVFLIPEDASVSFDAGNPVAVGVDEPGGDSDPFTLTVLVEETEPDLPAGSGMAGDIGLATVTLSLNPVGPGSPVAGTCAPSGTSGTGYDAVLTVDCTFDDIPVNTYVATVTVDGGYYTGSGEDVLVVYDTSLGFTTGGGWFYWPDTADEATGYAGDKTNVGYTMSYNKKGQKVKGNLVMIRHLADGSIYRVKSNALSGLALGTSNDGEDFGWASFSGKSTYREPGWADAVGNHTFIVYVEDHGTPGADVDRFWIEIRDKDGALIDASSMLASADTNAVFLGGGNIVVPHDGGNGKGKGGGKP